MALPGRPIEWIAVATVVLVGGAAALYLAPGQGPSAVPAPAGMVEIAPGLSVPSPMAQSPEQATSATLAPVASLDAAVSVTDSPRGTPLNAATTPASPRLQGDRLMILPEAKERSSAFAATAAAPSRPRIETSAASPNGAAEESVAATGRLPGAMVPVPGRVHYGVADRSELMGRGAGPVYNLRGARAVTPAASEGQSVKQQGPSAQASADDDQ